MNNNDKKINDLYLEKGTSQYDVDIIIELIGGPDGKK